MADHPQNLVQTKIYDILTGDLTLMGLVVGVWDNAPDNSDYPYVEIGDDDHSDWSSHTHQGFSSDLRLHFWSQARGRKEIKDIMNRVYTLLHNIDLAIVNFPTVSFRCELNEVIIDIDGRTYHGVQRYSLLLGGNNV